ncbi:MAG: hypothetical protein AB7R00_18735 [Kofleriaceae bacterium]
MSRLTVLGFVPLFAAATAAAQAPGEMAPSPVPTAPQIVVAAPKLHRWSIAVGVGAMGLAPKNAPDAQADFTIAEIAIRYLAGKNFEIELGASGGRQQLEDGSEGDLAMGSVMLAARYHFRPRQTWDWWLMGGLGGMVVAPHNSSDEQLEQAQRPAGVLGIGIERRFDRFAIQAEARAVAAAETEAEREMSVYGEQSGAYSGGLITVGVSYAF